MALTDLIRKRSADASAIASPAISAKQVGQQSSKIAKLAGIALANFPTAESKLATNNSGMPDIEILRQFRFDLVTAEIEAGCPAQEIQRVNNLAWELMKEDSMRFADAVRTAAKIVAHCDRAACEAAYKDVQALWKQIMGGA